MPYNAVVPQKTTPAKSNKPATDDPPWYGQGLSFKCTMCGNCCTGPQGFVWFSPEEGKAIAKFLGISERDFYARYCKKKLNRWTLDERRLPNGDYDCIFLDRDDKGRALCGIYPVRPTQCRTWPFWESNLTSKQAWDEAAEDCPGMKHGGNFVPTDQIRIILASNPRGL